MTVLVGLNSNPGIQIPGTVSMVPLSDFYPLILPSVVGAPEPLVDQILVTAAIRFCRESDCVQVIQPAIDVVAEVTEYTISPPLNMRINRVLRAWYKATPLAPMVPDMVDSALAYRGDIGLDVKAERGSPRVFYQQQPSDSTIKLWPIPAESYVGGLTLRVAFTPDYGVQNLPETLLVDWAQEFTAGVRSILHALPGYPFTDISRSAIEAQEFQAGIRAATIQTNTGNIRGAMRVRGNPLA